MVWPPSTHQDVQDAVVHSYGLVKPPIGGSIANPIAATTGQTPPVGSLDLGMLYLPGGTYSTVVCRVSTPVAGATVKMVAYKHDAANVLGTLLFDTAAVAATNGGYLSIALPSALVVSDPGYPIWVGLVNQGTAASSFWYGTTAGGLPLIVTAGTSTDLNNYSSSLIRLTSVTSAAPTSPTGVSAGPSGGVPRIALIRSA